MKWVITTDVSATDFNIESVCIKLLHDFATIIAEYSGAENFHKTGTNL